MQIVVLIYFSISGFMNSNYYTSPCIHHNSHLFFRIRNKMIYQLTHWGRVTHICVSKLTIVGSDNGFSPGRRQAIICTNTGLLLIGPLGINFSEILIEILTFSFKKMRLKVSSAKRQPFSLGLNVLMKARVQLVTFKCEYSEWSVSISINLCSILVCHFWAQKSEDPEIKHTCLHQSMRQNDIFFHKIKS